MIVKRALHKRLRLLRTNQYKVYKQSKRSCKCCVFNIKCQYLLLKLFKLLLQLFKICSFLSYLIPNFLLLQIHIKRKNLFQLEYIFCFLFWILDRGANPPVCVNDWFRNKSHSEHSLCLYFQMFGLCQFMLISFISLYTRQPHLPC